MWDLIRDCIPNDHSDQVSADYYVSQLIRESSGNLEVLDVGCGTGASRRLFRAPGVDSFWVGIDILDTPEVNARVTTDAMLCSYDGVRLPFCDNCFDVAYSRQVFEHVRHPECLLEEIHRILRPGGRFIGSVSYMEPYHSYSFWNFTPYGWHTLLLEAGLQPIEFRPGIDAISLIRRQYLGRPEGASTWFTSSPLNEEIAQWGKQKAKRPALINLRKLQFCGHLVFRADKPDE